MWWYNRLLPILRRITLFGASSISTERVVTMRMSNSQVVPFFALLMINLLTLAACGGQGEQAYSDGVVYVPETIRFTSPLDATESACISGGLAYLAGTIYGDDTGTEQKFSLVRMPLEGGKAEVLPAFSPARLEIDAEYESIGGHLRPGANGTVWLTENIYCSGKGSTLVLRQLDGEGNELSCFDGLITQTNLEAEQIYDLWTDGAGTFFVNTGSEVVLLDEAGTLQAALDGGNMLMNRFVSLSDGRVAIRSTVQRADGYTFQLRVIDTEAKDWGTEAFPVPNGAEFWSGERDVLFYYISGDALYAWHQDAEAAERVMSWMDSGVNTSGIITFSFLADGRLAAVTQDAGFRSKPSLALLTATEAEALPERTVLTLATVGLNGTLGVDVASFNSSSDTCFIQVINYLPDASLNTTWEEVEQARRRLIMDLTAGSAPDIIDLDMGLPVRGMEAQGILEDLWPYIDTDPDLGRNALMLRPLEAMEYNSGLYRMSSSFAFDTVIGQKSIVGDRLTWSYGDFWAALNTIPDGVAVDNYGSRSYVLQQMIQQGAERFIDWENSTSRFDGEEFCALLEFCARFPDEMDRSYDGGPDVAVYTGEQVLINAVIQGPDSFQYYKELLGGEVSCVGYPNGVGEVGSYFRLDGIRLAITAASGHKDEAWSFLRRYLLPKFDKSVTLKAGDRIEGFPINRADFETTMARAMTPVMETRNGELQEVDRYISTFTFGDIDASISIDTLSPTEYDQIMAIYNATERTSDYDVNLMNIITERAGAYFAGDCSLKDAAATIQSRVGLYLAEMQ